jgi:hypothetical protein
MGKLSTRKCGAVLQFVPRPRRLQIRITAMRGREPVGQTRSLMLRESDFVQLVAAAESLEGRR